MTIFLLCVVIAVITAPLRLLTYVFSEKMRDSIDRGRQVVVGYIADISTVVVCPLLFATFLLNSKLEAAETFSWSALVILITVVYFIASYRRHVFQPASEVLANSLVAAGIIINSAMLLGWHNQLEIRLLGCLPIIAVFLLCLFKREHYLRKRLAQASDYHKFDVEEILDYIPVTSATVTPIRATTSLDRQCLPVLFLPWPGRLIVYSLLGVLIILLFMIVPVPFGISLNEVCQFFNSGELSRPAIYE